MDARLPLNSNLGFYRKSAKELKRALSERDPSAAARFAAQHPKFRGKSAAEVFTAAVSLSDALLVIAREQGSASWSEFKKRVEAGVHSPEPSPSDRLLIAIRASDLAAARELCAGHPGLAALPDSKGVLPLVEAADRGLVDLARLLLDAGADPKQGDPLLAAAHPGPHKRKPALEVVELLLARGVSNDIFVHALLGRVDGIRDALPRVDVNARGPANSSALFLAAWNGQVAAVRLLLDAGAEPNPIGRNGQSAWQIVFLHAWSQPHREVATLLLDHGVPCTLHEACVLSHLPTVKRLIAEHPGPGLVSRPNEKGVTPLRVAVLKADGELVRVLLEAGAEDPKGQGRVLVSGGQQAGKSFARSVFRNCSFEATNFNDCSLKDAILSNINLSGASFDNVNLSGATIDNAYITGLKIYGIEIEPLLAKEMKRRAARKKAARP